MHPTPEVSALPDHHLTLYVLLTGVMGGLVLAILVMICCKVCLKTKKPLTRQHVVFSRNTSERDQNRDRKYHSLDSSVSVDIENSWGGMSDSSPSPREPKEFCPPEEVGRASVPPPFPCMSPRSLPDIPENKTPEEEFSKAAAAVPQQRVPDAPPGGRRRSSGGIQRQDSICLSDDDEDSPAFIYSTVHCRDLQSIKVHVTNSENGRGANISGTGSGATTSGTTTSGGSSVIAKNHASEGFINNTNSTSSDVTASSLSTAVGGQQQQHHHHHHHHCSWFTTSSPPRSNPATPPHSSTSGSAPGAYYQNKHPLTQIHSAVVHRSGKTGNGEPEIDETGSVGTGSVGAGHGNGGSSGSNNSNNNNSELTTSCGGHFYAVSTSTSGKSPDRNSQCSCCRNSRASSQGSHSHNSSIDSGSTTRTVISVADHCYYGASGSSNNTVLRTGSSASNNGFSNNGSETATTASGGVPEIVVGGASAGNDEQQAKKKRNSSHSNLGTPSSSPSSGLVKKKSGSSRDISSCFEYQSQDGDVGSTTSNIIAPSGGNGISGGIINTGAGKSSINNQTMSSTSKVLLDDNNDSSNVTTVIDGSTSLAGGGAKSKNNGRNLKVSSGGGAGGAGGPGPGPGGAGESQLTSTGSCPSLRLSREVHSSSSLETAAAGEGWSEIPTPLKEAASTEQGFLERALEHHQEETRRRLMTLQRPTQLGGGPAGVEGNSGDDDSETKRIPVRYNDTGSREEIREDDAISPSPPTTSESEAQEEELEEFMEEGPDYESMRTAYRQLWELRATFEEEEELSDTLRLDEGEEPLTLADLEGTGTRIIDTGGTGNEPEHVFLDANDDGRAMKAEGGKRLEAIETGSSSGEKIVASTNLVAGTGTSLETPRVSPEREASSQATSFESNTEPCPQDEDMEREKMTVCGLGASGTSDGGRASGTLTSPTSSATNAEEHQDGISDNKKELAATEVKIYSNLLSLPTPESRRSSFTSRMGKRLKRSCPQSKDRVSGGLPSSTTTTPITGTIASTISPEANNNNNSHHHSLDAPATSFDSVETEWSSTEASRGTGGEDPSTSFESTTTTTTTTTDYNTDNNTDSSGNTESHQSRRLHHMKADSGYKSLEGVGGTNGRRPPKLSRGKPMRSTVDGDSIEELEEGNCCLMEDEDTNKSYCCEPLVITSSNAGTTRALGVGGVNNKGPGSMSTMGPPNCEAVILIGPNVTPAMIEKSKSMSALKNSKRLQSSSWVHEETSVCSGAGIGQMPPTTLQITSSKSMNVMGEFKMASAKMNTTSIIVGPVTTAITNVFPIGKHANLADDIEAAMPGHHYSSSSMIGSKNTMPTMSLMETLIVKGEAPDGDRILIEGGVSPSLSTSSSMTSDIRGKMSVFQRFFRSSSGRPPREDRLHRDFSIDEKSDALFREFSRQDSHSSAAGSGGSQPEQHQQQAGSGHRSRSSASWRQSQLRLHHHPYHPGTSSSSPINPNPNPPTALPTHHGLVHHHSSSHPPLQHHPPAPVHHHHHHHHHHSHQHSSSSSTSLHHHQSGSIIGSTSGGNNSCGGIGNLSVSGSGTRWSEMQEDIEMSVLALSGKTAAVFSPQLSIDEESLSDGGGDGFRRRRHSLSRDALSERSLVLLQQDIPVIRLAGDQD